MPSLAYPPGPRSLLFGIDLVRGITRDPISFYAEAKRKYGDALYMRLGPYHDYTFFHPDAIHEILTTKAKSFFRMRRQMEVFRQWNGSSVVIVEGTDWVRQRRVLQPAFNPKRFEAYGQQVVRATEDGLRRLGSSETLDFERMASQLTTDVICRTMFGATLGSEADEVRKAATVLSKAAYDEMLSPFSLPLWVPWPSIQRKKRAIATIDQLSRRFIRERREGGTDTGDLLSMMLFAVVEELDGKGLTDEEVRDNCVTFFLAGHDTTAAGLTWLGWFLASRPELAERATAEIAMVVGDRRPTFHDLPKLIFLEQMINETLRHRSPAVGVFGREAIEDVEVGGWTIPKGALVHALSYTVHHDERWFPNPEVFDPDRFAPDKINSIHPHAYFPFGVGPRMCIGASFAKMELALTSATILQDFRLSPAEGQTEPTPYTDVTLRPKGGLRLKLQRK